MPGPESVTEFVWERVADRVGEDLRAVNRYTPTDFEAKMRPDVRALYTREEHRRIVDDTIIEQLSTPETERAFKAGELLAIVRTFEEAWIVLWSDGTGRKSGVNVSIQRDGERATMSDVEWCIEFLEDEVADRID